MSIILPQPAALKPSLVISSHSFRPVLWLAAAIVLFALQILSGTLPLFALLVFAFSVLTYLAVIEAGGLRSLMGICVFVLALQNVLVSQAAKVFLWQPAEKPLIWPLETLGIYCLTMAGIALAGANQAQQITNASAMYMSVFEINGFFWALFALRIDIDEHQSPPKPDVVKASGKATGKTGALR